MMENLTEPSAGQENNSAEIPVVSLGKMLREARERQGLSVMDVSSQIKFAPRQIEALEEDDLQHLPETAFLRGFVRSYAKILHLDAQVLLAALPQKKAVETELTPDSVEEPFPDIHSVLRHNLIWLGAALLLILIVTGFVLWHFAAPPEAIKEAKVETSISLPAEAPVNRAQPVLDTTEIEPVLPKMPIVKMPPSPAVTQPSVQVTGAAPSRSAKNKQVAVSGVQPVSEPDTTVPITSLRIEFSEDAWAEIKDRDGKILSSRLHSAGNELTVNGRAPFSLLIGHAKSVRLYYKGKEIDLAPHTRRSNEVASLTLE